MTEHDGFSETTSVLKGFLNIFRIAGRSARREYVSSVIIILFLFVGLLLVARLAIVSYMLSAINEDDHESKNQILLSFQIFELLFLITFPVLYALLFISTVRRSHDIGYSARWAVALYLTPVLVFLMSYAIAMVNLFIWQRIDHVSAIIFIYLVRASLVVNLFVIIVLCFWPSQPGPNRYGPNPNEVSQ